MDMLVALYKLEDVEKRRQAVRAHDVTIRRAMAYERDEIIDWVRQTFEAD